MLSFYFVITANCSIRQNNIGKIEKRGMNYIWKWEKLILQLLFTCWCSTFLLFSQVVQHYLFRVTPHQSLFLFCVAGN